jgi:hypothetical protein
LTCEESQRIFSALSVIKQRTAATVAGGGTSTAGPWDGEPNNSGNKQSITLNKIVNLEKICKICKRICETICKICKITGVKCAKQAK